MELSITVYCPIQTRYQLDDKSLLHKLYNEYEKGLHSGSFTNQYLCDVAKRMEHENLITNKEFWELLKFIRSLTGQNGTMSGALRYMKGNEKLNRFIPQDDCKLYHMKQLRLLWLNAQITGQELQELYFHIPLGASTI